MTNRALHRSIGLEILCDRNPFIKRTIFLARYQDKSVGKWFLGKPIEFEEEDPLRDPYHSPEPTFELTDSNCQALMDAIWSVGFRPSEGTGSAGALAAVERHLKDMQEIAFGSLRASGALEDKSHE